MSLYPQKQAILNKINLFYQSNRSGYLHVPTGWGKTFLSKYLIQQYLDRNKNVLFVVSQNNHLLGQTAFTKQQRVFPDSLVLSSRHDSVDIKDIRRRLRDGHSCMLFASLQTLLAVKNQKLRELISKKIDLLVVDEIHNFIKNKGTEFIQNISPSCKIFGMTATPFQGILSSTKHVDEIIEGMKVIHHEPLLDCINNGTLSKINYTIIHSKQNIVDVFDFTRGLQELTKQELVMDCSTMRKIQAAVKRTKLAKKIYDIKISPFSKTLVFCSPTQGLSGQKITSFHAKLSALIFNDEQFVPNAPFSNYTVSHRLKNTAYLTSDMPEDEQQEVMEGFRDLSKPPYVLCTVGMLIEGFNFPDLQNLIMLRPTLSMRLFEQQVGRILRKPENSQKEWGNVYEIADDIDPLYTMFRGQIFNKDIAEQLQLLQPRIRIERLLLGNNRMLCEDMSRIKITEISDRDELTVLLKSSAANKQIEHLEKMIGLLDGLTEGSLGQENLVLQDVAARIRMYTVDDLHKVVELINRLPVMANNALHDENLSCACRKKKPDVLMCLSWLLKMNVAYTVGRMSILPIEKMKILSSIGCGGDIDGFRSMCVQNGTGKSIKVVQNMLDQPECGNKVSSVLRKWDRLCRRYYGNWMQFM